MNRGEQENLRKHRISIPYTTYFITKCICNPREEILKIPEAADIVIDSMIWLQKSSFIHTGCFVIMPDHFHIVFSLGENRGLSEVIESLSRFTSKKINSLMETSGRFWKSGYYDHAVRQNEYLPDIIKYVHDNPVRKGLVCIPEEWKYSTANPEYSKLIDREWFGYLW